MLVISLGLWVEYLSGRFGFARLLALWGLWGLSMWGVLMVCHWIGCNGVAATGLERIQLLAYQ